MSEVKKVKKVCGPWNGPTYKKCLTWIGKHLAKYNCPKDRSQCYQLQNKPYIKSGIEKISKRTEEHAQQDEFAAFGHCS
jgi:hypothetical protein